MSRLSITNEDFKNIKEAVNKELLRRQQPTEFGTDPNHNDIRKETNYSVEMATPLETVFDDKIKIDPSSEDAKDRPIDAGSVIERLNQSKDVRIEGPNSSCKNQCMGLCQGLCTN